MSIHKTTAGRRAMELAGKVYAEDSAYLYRMANDRYADDTEVYELIEKVRDRINTRAQMANRLAEVGPYKRRKH